MSLLLEALKKAEKAKEEAQRRAKGGGEAEAAGDPDATVVEPSKRVRTRDELPDISQPLEILSDDLRPPAQPVRPSPSAALALVDEPAPAAEAPAAAARREPPRADSSAAEGARTERAAAQKVFEAKFKEPNPRLPFYITMGTLALFGIGTGIYFWNQLRPAPSLVNTNPPRPAAEQTVAAADKPGAVPGAPAAAPGQTAIAGLPGGASAPQAAAPAAAQPASRAAPAASASAAAPAAQPAESAPRSPLAARSRPVPAAMEERDLSVRRAAPQIHPQVATGYAALQAGELEKARGEYQLALRDDPGNRDALLGLAALEIRAQRFDLADAYYQRLLQADPRDPYAQAGYFALRGAQLDPLQVESRVKALLAADRDANVLYFTLGNQYAQQGRWAEAQQAYFKAFAADPENPDFAFNLAVSLDQMRQPQLALEYYGRALTLSEKRAASFAAATARARVQQLSR